MKSGRFHLPKCRGKVQRMRVMYTHSSIMPSPSSNFFIAQKNKLKKIKRLENRGGVVRLRAAIARFTA